MKTTKAGSDGITFEKFGGHVEKYLPLPVENFLCGVLYQ